MTNVSDVVLSNIEKFLLLLSQKERFVITRRFNLDRKERSTLEEIGQHFSVTRERIRQIEKNALNKLRRNLENFELKIASDHAYEILMQAGGIIKEDILLAKVLNLTNGYFSEVLQLVLAVDKRFERFPNTIFFHPHLRLSKFSDSVLHAVSRSTINYLKKNKEVSDLKKVLEIVVSEVPGLEMDVLSFSSFLQIDKKLKLVDGIGVGLIEWRHINPKTLRDKIFYVLRNNKKPLHFVEIANRIVEHGFDRKKVNLQAVHNELIRYDQFVLIGRGIYGLKEWGYVPGTVAEVIEAILRDKGTLSQDEIVQNVLKQRIVKPITIVLSLKNKSQFVRVGRKHYALKTT